MGDVVSVPSDDKRKEWNTDVGVLVDVIKRRRKYIVFLPSNIAPWRSALWEFDMDAVQRSQNANIDALLRKMAMDYIHGSAINDEWKRRWKEVEENVKYWTELLTKKGVKIEMDSVGLITYDVYKYKDTELIRIWRNHPHIDDDKRLERIYNALF